MLVKFQKDLILEGNGGIEIYKEHFWSEKKARECKVYLNASISGICDETEVAKEVKRLEERLLKKEKYERVVPVEDFPKIAKRQGWSNRWLEKYAPTSNEPIIENINEWSITKVLDTLNVKQFKQFCKENNLEEIVLKG